MFKKSPLVSIITPLYNGERFIADAIDSALNQTYRNIELIIINDGSTDSSKNVVSKYFSDDRVRYVEQENGGVASARNAGITVARGDYVGFLDQDDIWLEDKLESQVRFLTRDAHFALVHAKQNYINERGEIEPGEVDDGFDGCSGYCFKELFIRNRIAVLTVLIRKSVLDNVGVFNKNIPGGDDYEMWMRISRDSKIGYMNRVVALYRRHESNVSNDRFRMTITDLGAINSVLSNPSDVVGELGRGVVNKRKSQLNYQLGIWYMFQQNNRTLARKHFWKAICHRPNNFKAIDFWSKSFFKRSLINKFNWYLAKTKSLFTKSVG